MSVGYAYICGDAKHMAREVEHALEDILGKAKGGGKEEGAKELKLLKDRNRLLLDVSRRHLLVSMSSLLTASRSQVWS